MPAFQYTPSGQLINPLFQAAGAIGQGMNSQSDPMMGILNYNARLKESAGQGLLEAQKLQLAHAQLMDRGQTPTQGARYGSQNAALGPSIAQQMVQDRFDKSQEGQQARFDANQKAQQERQQAQIAAQQGAQAKQQQARETAQQERERADELAKQALGIESDRRSKREQQERIATDLRAAGIDPNLPATQAGIAQGTKQVPWYDRFLPGDQSSSAPLPATDPNMLAYEEYQRLNGQNPQVQSPPAAMPSRAGMIAGGRGAPGPSAQTQPAGSAQGVRPGPGQVKARVNGRIVIMDKATGQIIQELQ